jgi:hypothetical protein
MACVDIKPKGHIVGKKTGGTRKPGSTFTKTITRGPNKGDRVTFGVGPSGKPYPKRVLKDKGNNSTLKNNPGVRFEKKKK